MGDQRRSDPGALRARRRHAVSADPGGADRGRGGDLSSGQAGDHRQGRRGARDPRAGQDPAVRQDGDAHVGDPAGRRCRDVRRDRRERALSARRLARPSVAARARDGDRPRRPRARPGAFVPRGRQRALRRGDRRRRRRPEGVAGQGGLRHRRRAPATASPRGASSHDDGWIVIRVRRRGRGGGRRPRDRRPDQTGYAAGDPRAPTIGHRARRDGHRGSSGRGGVGRGRPRRRPDPVRTRT